MSIVDGTIVDGTIAVEQPLRLISLDHTCFVVWWNMVEPNQMTWMSNPSSLAQEEC